MNENIEKMENVHEFAPFCHGTSLEVAIKAMKGGIKPRKHTGTVSTWEEMPSGEELVYLGTMGDLPYEEDSGLRRCVSAAILAAKRDQSIPVILEVNTIPDLPVVPDEDAYRYIEWIDRLETEEDWEYLGLSNEEEADEFEQKWFVNGRYKEGELSVGEGMMRTGTIAVLGNIPARAIECIYELKEVDSNKWGKHVINYGKNYKLVKRGGIRQELSHKLLGTRLGDGNYWEDIR